MKLVVLDGYTLNPEDLSWEPLRALADCEFYDRTAEDQIVQRAEGAPLILTNKAPLRGKTLDCLPALRYIGVTATGYDIIDLDKAAEMGVTVTNVPAYGTDSVAQFVFALLLELALQVGRHNEAVQQGAWARNPDYSFWLQPLVELKNKVMGIVGYGRIGSSVANIAQAFGMTVMATGNTRPESLPVGIRWSGLDELISNADVISLHCPLTAATRGLIHSARIARMKPTALLINTSRGGLIVEPDLAAALNQGVIAGAAVDVLSSEPPPIDNPLIGARNCIVTPHIAWASHEARARLLAIAISNLSAWLSGSPINVVGLATKAL